MTPVVSTPDLTCVVVTDTTVGQPAPEFPGTGGPSPLPGDALPPLTTAERDRLVAVAEAAGHWFGVRPWHVVVTGDDTIELRLDSPPAGSTAGADDRWAVTATGAALFNLRQQIRALSRRAMLRPFPDAGDPGLAARVELRAGNPQSPEERRLLGVVEQQRRWTGRFSRVGLAEVHPPQLAHQAVREGAVLVPVATRAHQDRLARLLVEAVAEQHDDCGSLPEWLDPVWPVPQPDGTGSGTARSWEPAVRGVAYRETLMVLLTQSDEPSGWLRGGSAMQRVLLTATRFGLVSGHIEQPLRSAALRAGLTRALGLPGYPLALLRFGYPDAARSAGMPGRPAVGGHRPA